MVFLMILLFFILCFQFALIKCLPMSGLDVDFVVFHQTNAIQAGLIAFAKDLILLIVKDRKFARALVTTAVCTSNVSV